MKKKIVSQDEGGGQVIVRVERESSGKAPKTKYVIRVCPNSTQLSGAGDIVEQQYSVGTRHTADLGDQVPNELIEKSTSPKSNLKTNNKNLNGTVKNKTVGKKVTISESDKLKNNQSKKRNDQNKSFCQNKREARPSTALKICEKVNKKLDTKKETSKLDPNESFEIYRQQSNVSVQQKQYFSFNNIKIIKETKNVEQKQILPNTQVGYDCLVDMIKKMKKTHWIMIDKMYKKLTHDRYVMYKSLSELINTIVEDVYGKYIGQSFMEVIDTNKRNAITKLAKILLNLYQEAYEEHIQEKATAQKKYYYDKLKANPTKKELEFDNKKLNPANVYYREPRKSTRCEACHPVVDKSNTCISKIVPKKCKIQKPTINKNKRITLNKEQAEKPLEGSISENNKDTVVRDVKPEAEPQIQLESVKTLKRSASDVNVSNKVAGPIVAKGENVGVFKVENEPAGVCSTRQHQVLETLERSLLRLFQSPDEVGLDEVIRSAVCGKEVATDSFQTTLDLLWLNDRVEKRRLEDEMDLDLTKISSFQSAIRDSPEEEVSKEEMTLSAKSWLPQDCLLNMGYVNIGISVMCAIAAAYFSREEVSCDESISMKATLKKYLKQFLEGALRLVDGS